MLLAVLLVAGRSRPPISSDLMKSECELDSMYEVWGQAFTERSMGAPLVSVIALDFFSGGASLVAAEHGEFVRGPSAPSKLREVRHRRFSE